METQRKENDVKLEGFCRMLAGCSQIMRSYFCSSLTWKNNLFFVQIGSRFGLFDNEGNVLVPPEYDEILDYEHEEVCRVRKGENWGLYKKGEGEICPCVYHKLNMFYDGLLIFTVIGEWKYTKDYWDPWNTYFGIMEMSTGRVLVPADFDCIETLSDGLARVEKNDKWGYYDVITQRLTIPCQYEYDNLGYFLNGVVEVTIDNGVLFLNRNGDAIENPNSAIGNKPLQ